MTCQRQTRICGGLPVPSVPLRASWPPLQGCSGPLQSRCRAAAGSLQSRSGPVQGRCRAAQGRCRAAAGLKQRSGSCWKPRRRLVRVILQQERRRLEADCPKSAPPAPSTPRMSRRPFSATLPPQKQVPVRRAPRDLNLHLPARVCSISAWFDHNNCSKIVNYRRSASGAAGSPDALLRRSTHLVYAPMAAPNRA
jgi:hypothetical protein